MEIERYLGDLEVMRIPVRENGLVATLFLPPSETPLPVVITLTGSGGGLSESRAQILASHGFASLALAYFREENLPPVLKEIPLEYFQTAIEWLKMRPEIDGKRIGLWGVSRGGELALLLGTVFPDDIQAIAAFVPSSVAYGAITDKDAPAWVYKGKPLLPNAPFSEQIYDSEMGQTPEKAIPLTPSFLLGMEEKAAFEAAAIPVEKIQCPILLVSGQDDQMWPSALFCQQITERLKAQGSSIFCTHLSYPRAGHSISPSLNRPKGTLEQHPIAKLWFTFGGNEKEDALAREDAWKHTLHFFRSNLNGSRGGDSD
ncbi:MAG TPA: acyl-CoA thioester hydrolase/BAAT C-terminal domain-containing protein [Chlamydiales bacterium]|nr:acyl-CoA thioester hydrolase/BAAT C-terminal domain-containing protein [Chlamydiales bacterium]